MTNEYYHLLIYSKQEDRNREFKQSFAWDRDTNGETLAKIVKTIMAMGNLRDGGHIVIGVNEEQTVNGTNFVVKGIEFDHLKSYSYDNIVDFVRKYADPQPTLTFEIITIDEMKLGIITIRGYDEIPIICKNNYGNILTNGTIYYRPRSGRPRSEPISAYTDTRELMDLAVEKGVRRFFEFRARVSESILSDFEYFDRQQKEFSKSELLESIKSRGHWQIVIRPMVFDKELIPTLYDCQNMMSKNQVRNRGWYFPHIEDSHIIKGTDYLELQVNFLDTKETWRYYQSGLFIFFRGLTEDWSEDVTEKRSPSYPAGSVLDVLGALHQLSEVYEFCTRLAQSGILSNQVNIKINLVNIFQRKLFFWPGSGRRLSIDYVCKVRELPYEQTIMINELVSSSREYSYKHFTWLMERFGFQASESVFRRDQEKFFEGRF